jgi:6-phosphofructokinase 1
LGVAAVEGLMVGRRGVMAGMISGQIAYTSLTDAIKKDHVIDKELIRISDVLML